MRTRGTGAFTLIEMLTVLVIVGIILAIGIPAFTNLMKSGGLGAAARQVSNTLTLARQYAITRRTNVRVVFPFSGTGGAGTNLAPLYQSYAVVAVNGTTTNYLSKWERLPLGTVFLNASTLTSSSLDDLGAANLPYPYTNSPPATLAFIEFRPWGAATPNPLTSGPNIITITEGNMNGAIPQPTSRNITNAVVGGITNALANAAFITVDSVIGKITVTRP